MRFWKELIGLLSLGKVVGENEPVVFKTPEEVKRDNILKEAFENTGASIGVQWVCVLEMYAEAEKTGNNRVKIEAISKDYLPGCFKVFSTKNKPNSGELEESDESDLKNPDINKELAAHEPKQEGQASRSRSEL